MERRNLIMAPCGNKSFLFDKWTDETVNRNFDLCLLFYHETVNEPERYQKSDYFFHLKGFKFNMIYDVLKTIRPDLLDKYDYFYFLDDDINISTEKINQMFDLSRAFGTSISQASLTHDSFCSWPILKHNKNCFVRYVGQIEVMAPLFSAEALKICLSSFKVNRSSWGLDSAWPKQLGYPKDKMVVFDEVQMAHTLPVGGGELYDKIKADPHEDWDKVVEQFGAVKNNFTEYGRLQKVTAKHSPIKRQQIKLIEFKNKLKQQYNDLGIGWRIRNKLGMKQPS